MAENNYIGVAEAAQVLGVSRTYLYKLTCMRLIPFYKPRGGKLLFDKAELMEYIKGCRVTSREDMDAMVAGYVAERG